jgi:hypothetical protein
MAHKFVCEVEFHACCYGGVDDQLGRVVLRSPASDAIDYGILACECCLEGIEGVVVDGLCCDVGVGGWVIGG